MKILLTGATGFVGTAVIKRLAEEDTAVAATILYGEDAGHLPAGVQLITVPALCGSSDYTEAFHHVDVVVHLAARVHVMHETATNPLDIFRVVNVHGTERLARQAAAAGVRRFVFVSTVKVHGEETAVPYTEESPLAPLDPYGISKSEAEGVLWRVASETGLEVVIVRPPLVYGAGVKANFLQMLSAVNRGLPLPLASIHNTRSLIYVENLADALTRCAIDEKAAGHTFLVSDGDDMSTPELLRRAAQALGKPCRLLPLSPCLLRAAGKLFGKSQAVDRLLGSLQVDTSRIRQKLGWTPPFSVARGLEKTAQWFRAQALGQKQKLPQE